MNLYLAVPLFIAMAVVQSTIIPHLAIGGVFVDLPMVAVVSWALLRGSEQGLLWGFFAGLSLDLLSGAPFGATTLALMVVGFLTGSGKSTALRSHLGVPVLIVVLATIVYNILYLLIVDLSGGRIPWLDTLIRIVLPVAALNALLAPVVFGLMRWFYTRFGRQEMEW
jgi:rod shape-determining protein MreD